MCPLGAILNLLGTMASVCERLSKNHNLLLCSCRPVVWSVLQLAPCVLLRLGVLLALFFYCPHRDIGSRAHLLVQRVTQKKGARPGTLTSLLLLRPCRGESSSTMKIEMKFGFSHMRVLGSVTVTSKPFISMCEITSGSLARLKQPLLLLLAILVPWTSALLSNCILIAGCGRNAYHMLLT